MNRIKLLSTSSIICILMMSPFVMQLSSMPLGATGEETVEKSGVKGGLVVHLGSSEKADETVDFLASLRVNDRYVVQGLETDQKKISAVRGELLKRGIYGKISMDDFDGEHLPYADNLVNLIVVDKPGKVSMDEIMRALAPGGVARINGRNTIKPRPSDIDEWTHCMHAPDGNAVSTDEKAGLPRRLQWRGTPLWGRDHGTSQGIEACVSGNGRLFFITDMALPLPLHNDKLPEKWTLVARDAFNGIFLWKKEMEDFGRKAWGIHGTRAAPKQRYRRLVVDGETVYVTLGLNAPVTALNAADGSVIRTYEGTEFTSEIVCSDGILVIAQRVHLKEENIVSNRLIAFETKTGKMLWKTGLYQGADCFYPTYRPFQDLKVVIGEEKVFFLAKEDMVCLDLNNGKEIWKTPRNINMSLFDKNKKQGGKGKDNFHSTFLHHSGMLFLLQPHVRNRYSTASNPGTAFGISAETGKVLWQEPCSQMGFGTQSALLVANNLVWMHKGSAFIARELKTGKQVRSIPLKELMDAPGTHPRCYPEKATETFFFTSVGGRPLQMVDMVSEELAQLPWLKTGCRLGIFPCNGFVYVLPHPCVCQNHVRMNGLLSFSAAEVTFRKTGETLVQGPAYGKVKYDKTIPAQAWPAYRHDSKRSGGNTTTIALPLKKRWHQKLPGKLTQPTVVDDKVFVASADTHTVYALNIETGETIWNFTCGGIVDSSPTFYRGMVLFGSQDGRVYSLDAASGELVWRFRAAPEERRVVLFDKITSSWPVHGSILIKDDIAYVAAGVNSYLDGGVHLYALDPLTGRVLDSKKENTTGTKKPKYPVIEGTQADILVSNGKSVYMRESKVTFDKIPEKENAYQGREHLYSEKGLLDENWFHRTKWSFGTTRNESGDLVSDKGFSKRFASRMRKNYGDLIVFDRDASYSINIMSESGVRIAAKGLHTGKPLWQGEAPLFVKGMAVAGDLILMAGTSAKARAGQDPWMALEDRGAAKLIGCNKKDGKHLFDLQLPANPVLDGMSAAYGKIFISCKDGSVVCIGQQ